MLYGWKSGVANKEQQQVWVTMEHMNVIQCHVALNNGINTIRIIYPQAWEGM